MAQTRTRTSPAFRVVSEQSPESTAAAPAQFAYPLKFRLLDVFAVLLVAIFLCMYQLGASSMAEGDQTTHSLVVQNMVHTGQLLHPQYDGRPYFNKPPFKMWVATIPVLLLGESTYSYRVIDGLCGVLLAVGVFLFARAMFSSRLAGYLSVVALLGAQVLYFGHGVRNAVQDGMMLLLMSLATMTGWFFVERIRNEQAGVRARLTGLALIGGTLIGCAALTKNVAGYFALAILGLFILFGGDLMMVLRRAWPQLILILALSFGIPAAYILAQGKNTTLAFQMLILTEVLKRAVHGYHFVSHHWIYWNAIVKSRIAVAPEALFPAVAVGFAALFARRDKRYLFLLIWAIAPVLIQNAMASKLLWYILPAVPGMALLTGCALTDVIAFARDPRESKTRRRFGALLAGVCGIAIAVSFGIMVSRVVAPPRNNPTDEMIQDIREYVSITGRPIRAAFYQIPKMNKHEIFYWSFLPTEKIDDRSALLEKLKRGELDFVITGRQNMEDLARLKPIASYSTLPVRGRRRQWLGILGYNAELLPRHFRAAMEHIEFEELEPTSLAYGLGLKRQIGSVRFLVGMGPRSAIDFEGSGLLTQFPLDGKVSLASLVPTAKGAISTTLFLNETPIATFSKVTEGFNDYSFHVPPGLIEVGMNHLLFRSTPPAGVTAGDRDQIVLYDSIELGIAGSPPISASREAGSWEPQADDDADEPAEEDEHAPQ